MKITAAVALLLLLVTACGSGVGTQNDLALIEQEGAKPGHHVSGPLLVSAPTDPDGASLTAMVSGVVENNGDCITVGGVPVLWPHGSTWDATVQTITVPYDKGAADDVVVRIGQHVEGGGGSWPLPEVNTVDYSEAAHELARSCLGPDGQITSLSPSMVHDVAPDLEPGGTPAVSSPQAIFSSGPILVLPQPNQAREQMLLRGVVGLLQGGNRSCLSLEDMPIVFEHGATWDEASSTARTAEGVTLTPGQYVEGGGSTAAWSSIDRSRFTGEAAELVDACVGEQGQVAFLHP
ncbi:hypothetical protein FHR75_004488 [Kineococcus radiotolerans]|uniref:Lipoprotein n=1 Tax=Kineococcus radiotolerans TaxID=131568 RepID=A0A7W4XZS4_KINRA|nr:hypothetical protein [Kineococcus radiotolerans]MBB2903645.1 hypothetical protein [Kineococcus radiotolerans]